MKTFRALLYAAALALLAITSQPAAACVATYTDFEMDLGEGELEAWGWVGDFYSSGPCFYEAYYQWGFAYWEHTYDAFVEIESPTLRVEDELGVVWNVPYGGGSAMVSAVISVIGDAGKYKILWFLSIFCDIGGWFQSQADTAELHAVPITIHRHTSVTMIDEGDVEQTILPLANGVLQTKDHETNDVACPMAMHRSGPIGQFYYGNGIIEDPLHEAYIFNYPELASVVREVNYCGGPATAYIGCGATGAGFIVEESISSSIAGIAWAHEYGHHRDNDHTPINTQIMYEYVNANTKRVTQTQCDKMKSGP
jgi:hypothetical protein